MHTANQAAQPLPPSIGFLVALGWGGASAYLGIWMREWGILATIGCFITGVFSVKSLISSWNAWDTFRSLGWHEKQVDKISKKRNQVRFSNQAEIEAAGLNAESGLFFGSHDGKDLVYSGEKSATVISPAGCNKTTSVLLPTLFLAAAILKRALKKKLDLSKISNFVINDPSGEIEKIVGRVIEAAGYQVLKLAPWTTDGKDVGLNIFASVSGSESVVVEEVEMRTSLVAFEREGSNSKSSFFLIEARKLINAVALYLFSLKQVPTLSEIRRRLKGSPQELQDMFLEMATSKHFLETLPGLGKELAGTMAAAPQQFAAGLSTALQAIDIYKGRLGEHSDRAGLDPSVLKGDKPTVVFLNVPPDKKSVNASWVNTTLSFLIECVASDPRNKRCVFLIDEAANMGGAIPNLLYGMSEYRKYGFQCVTFWQSASQISRLHSEAGLKELLNQSGVISTFGIVEHESCKLFSEMAGKTLVDLVSENMKREQVGESYGLSIGEQSLITPQQIRTMSKDQALVFFENLLPIMATKVNYWTRPEWNKQAGKNPFFRK